MVAMATQSAPRGTKTQELKKIPFTLQIYNPAIVGGRKFNRNNLLYENVGSYLKYPKYCIRSMDPLFVFNLIAYLLSC